MPKFFINTDQKQEKKIYIQGEDVNHIKNVLRKKIGDELIICDKDKSQDYSCTIQKINDNKIECIVKEELETNVEPHIQVTIFQGLPKADKMELIIQKAVELGVYDITPIQMERCIVKINDKDKIKKIQRWQKISEVASKQSGRNIIPNINNIINARNICNFTANYDIVLIAYENEQNNTLKNEIEKLKNTNKKDLKIGIIIGPEGGIDEKEIEIFKKNGFKIITLGKRILRTETVALNILSIIMYELDN